MTNPELLDLCWETYVNATRTGDRDAIAKSYAVYREVMVRVAAAGAYAKPTREVDWTDGPVRGGR